MYQWILSSRVKVKRLVHHPVQIRDSIIRLAQQEGLEIREKRITRDEVYLAEEAFFTGTAAEVTPVGQIGTYNFEVGSLTREIAESYEKLVRA